MLKLKLTINTIRLLYIIKQLGYSLFKMDAVFNSTLENFKSSKLNLGIKNYKL